jgi:hypothetical protein
VIHYVKAIVDGRVMAVIGTSKEQVIAKLRALFSLHRDFKHRLVVANGIDAAFVGKLADNSYFYVCHSRQDGVVESDYNVNEPEALIEKLIMRADGYVGELATANELLAMLSMYPNQANLYIPGPQEMDSLYIYGQKFEPQSVAMLHGMSITIPTISPLDPVIQKLSTIKDVEFCVTGRKEDYSAIFIGRLYPVDDVFATQVRTILKEYGL